MKCPFWLPRHFTSKLRKPFHLTLLYNAFFQLSFFFLMAPNFLALATTLENLGARWLLAKKVNFVPCITQTTFKTPQREIHYHKMLLLYNNNYCKFIISSPVDSSLHGADLMPFLITEQSMIRLLDKNNLDKIKGS